MNCAQSIELLSEFHAGQLDEPIKVEVTEHLLVCVPCADVLQDLKLIIGAARFLQNEDGITFPDEDAVWQRMRFAKRIAL